MIPEVFSFQTAQKRRAAPAFTPRQTVTLPKSITFCGHYGDQVNNTDVSWYLDDDGNSSDRKQNEIARNAPRDRAKKDPHQIPCAEFLPG